jgi:hypothetical protein
VYLFVSSNTIGLVCQSNYMTRLWWIHAGSMVKMWL